jgi:hypothetical protein
MMVGDAFLRLAVIDAAALMSYAGHRSAAATRSTTTTDRSAKYSGVF